MPAGKLIVTNQSGLLVVNCDADMAMALVVSQLLSCEMEPVILIVSPQAVVTSSLKVTATVDGHVVDEGVVVVDVMLLELAPEVVLPVAVVVTGLLTDV